MAAAAAAPPIPAPNHTPLPSSLTSSRPHSQLKELSRNREPHHRIRSSRVAGMVVAELTMTARWCRTPHRRRHRANDGMASNFSVVSAGTTRSPALGCTDASHPEQSPEPRRSA
ncbi:hypothetical protein Zm00014a_011448 [Zea mays]|uniref:Uncharacterized protein n=1 Tax=Zea mays TaxID=4577 RepID=A0A317Y1K5_MAIZE|nr:hypothetical protein Zm00014a_011448 [Zea mays]